MKYSEDSRIASACFSFQVFIGLLDFTLSSLKLHTENNACMLCAAISCWARLFLQHLRRRSLWIIRDTDDRWIPRLKWNFSDCSVVLKFVSPTQQQRLDCVDVFINMRTASAAARTHVLHSYRFLILSTLLNGVKVGAFAWHSVKIRVIFSARFERVKD